MFNRIKGILRKVFAGDFHFTADTRSNRSQSGFIWCLVGNIVVKQHTGEDGKIRYGTKHFSPKTKVYCFPIQWGDGYESIRVIGRHRKSKRSICIVMPSKLITNWRLQKVYNPHIIKTMRSKHGWTDRDDHRDTILQMLKWLPERTIKTIQ